MAVLFARRLSARRVLVSLACVAVLATGCGSSDGDATSPTTSASEVDEGPVSTASSPFEVTEPPKGFELVRADEGTQEPTWGDENVGSTEPFALFVPEEVGPVGGDGDGEVADVVAVSTFGLAGPEIEVGSVNTPLRSGGETSVLTGGDRGQYETGPGWSELLLVRRAAGDRRVGVRVSASTVRPHEQLLGWAEAVEVPAEATRPPASPAGLTGLRELGTVDARAGEAVWGAPFEFPLRPIGSHVQLWTTPTGAQVVVRALPGSAADLAALGRHPWLGLRRVEGSADDLVRLERCYEPEVVRACDRSVVVRTAQGDLVTVASDDRAGLDLDDLARIAVSVRSVDDARWDELRTEAFGAGEADPGSTVLERGTSDGIDWILQTSGPLGSGVYDTEWAGIDPCLKGDDLRRHCPSISTGNSPTGYQSWLLSHRGGAGGEPGLGVAVVLLRGGPDASSIRVTGPAIPASETSPGRDAIDLTVALRPTPTGGGRFAVVPARVGVAACFEPTDPTAVEAGQHLASARVALLDETGNEVGCLGQGGF